MSAAMQERFVDRGEIARGGGGLVRRTFDRETEREVAIKYLEEGVDARVRAHFLSEARVMARLDHPGILPVYDIGRDEHGEPSYLLMKLVEGRKLDDAIAATAAGPVSADALEPLLRALVRVCEAVSFAHGQGVIHRDLKPGNVMLGSHGEVYTMDWGMALVRDAPGHVAPSAPLPSRDVCGTPAYMAPEQARGIVGDIDERSDVFGLGGILYELLTLRPPHLAADLPATLAAARRCHVTPADEAAPARNVPARLAAICSRALSAERERRHPSAGAFARDLEAFLHGGGWFPVERFAAGAIMLREGEVGDRAYIISDGDCEVFHEIGGRIEVLRRIGAGHVVGEVGLFAPGPRIASVRALGDVSALVVTRAALDRELVRAPWIGSLLRQAAERYSEAEGLRDLAGRPRPGKKPRSRRPAART